MAVVLVACGGGESSDDTPSPEAPSTVAPTETAAPSDDAPSQAGTEPADVETFDNTEVGLDVAIPDDLPDGGFDPPSGDPDSGAPPEGHFVTGGYVVVAEQGDGTSVDAELLTDEMGTTALRCSTGAAGTEDGGSQPTVVYSFVTGEPDAPYASVQVQKNLETGTSDFIGALYADGGTEPTAYGSSSSEASMINDGTGSITVWSDGSGAVFDVELTDDVNDTTLRMRGYMTCGAA